MSDSVQKTKIAIFTSVVAFSVILDQVTKHLVHTRFRWGESLSLIPSVFALTYVRNEGAAFGMLNKAPSAFRTPFFLLVPFAALILILFLLWRLDGRQRLTALALSLVASGAVGNLIDRIHYSYVVDFLDFHWREVYHWPAFNVADCCIVVGVGILFWQSFKQRQAPANPQP